MRVACDEGAMGAEVSVNGKFKGECPVDVQVPAGNIVISATKLVNGRKQVFEQKLRLGDDVTKRLEVSFGSVAAASETGPVQVDLKAVARERYEAELAAYTQSIQACLPKYATEMQRLEQALKVAYKTAYMECLNENSTQISNSMEANGRSRAWVSETYCGPTTWNDDHKNYFVDFKDTSEYKDYSKHYVTGAQSWCASQFTAPRAPN